MAEQGFKRKLTAILSADVEGYSRLMGDDEEATVRTLKLYREVLSTLIQQHNGKVLDSPGDNLLAEFVSVVDAVQCAVAVQKEIKARNDELTENRRMQFRIGINLGDVIQEEDRIYGDGVNIAARLEGLAEPGGICISKTAFDHIESKLPYGYDFMGDQTVKNIAKPVGAYRVLMEPRVTVSGKPLDKKPAAIRRMPALVGVTALIMFAIAGGIWKFYMRRSSVEPVSVEKMAYPLPEKPSIAVLPFVNMSGDPEQEYFSDGITEEIIASLSRLSDLFVIARNSSFTYKGKAVWVPDVSRELGVRYILEGSVRRAGDKVRITAQLIDGKTNRHVWSETYDRQLKDIFAIQDEVTIKVLTAVKVEVVGDAERILAAASRTSNLRAYLKILEGMAHGNANRFTESREAYEEALSLDPDCAAIYEYLAWANFMDVWFGASATRGQSLQSAFEYAQKCLALDESNPGCHRVLGHAYLLKRDYQKALSEGKRSIELNPNSPESATMYGWTLRSVGQYEEAIQEYKRAMRLDPMQIEFPLTQLGATYFMMGRPEEAIATNRQVLALRKEGGLSAWLVLAMAFSSLDRMEEARTAVSEVLKLSPNFSLEYFARTLPYKSEAVRQAMVDALRKAGMK